MAASSEEPPAPATAKEEEPRAPAKRSRRRSRSRPRRQAPDFSSTLEGCRAAASEWFDIHKLYPEQEEAMASVLARQDTLVVLPTGHGKSLIYQVPALLFGAPVLVISPLIALMRDQERKLRGHGVSVVRLDSTLRVASRRQALNRIRKGGRLVILTTPETLESEAARPYLMEAKPALLCVDEAHCISEWGHDFRPAYLRLGAERKALGNPPVLALTATATPRVEDDIVERLRLHQASVVRASPHRENLRLSVISAQGNLKLDAAGKLLKRLRRPGIVYCATTKAVDEIYAALRRARMPVARYHGKMTTADRVSAQRRYMKSGRQMIMIATNAFGMGVDKPDIRYILHYQTPGSPEQYVQEAGRAGRDGLPSECILLFDPDDMKIQEYLQKQGRPNSSQLRRIGAALAAWAGEDRAVGVKELALSAQVPMTTCRSLCAGLEETGFLKMDSKRKYLVQVGAEELHAGVEDLACRFETQRMQDARRLEAIVEYADSDTCRSVFIRRWFGEDDPPECGRCDRCAVHRILDEEVSSVRRRAIASSDGEAPDEPLRPRRRRRRPRRSSVLAQPMPASRRRRRRRKSRAEGR